MSFYSWIDVLIISIPLALSFGKKIFYFKKWSYALGAILIAAPAYIAWNVLAIFLGDWFFNPRYIGTVKFLNLPIAEACFFVAISFSCIFVYEVVQCFSKDREISFNKNIIYIFIIFLMAAALFYQNKNYTSISLIFLAAFFFLSVNFFKEIVFTKNFVVCLTIFYAPLLISKGILAGLPVIIYNPQAIWGARILSIPIEDFIYTFTFLGFSVIAYKILIRKKSS